MSFFELIDLIHLEFDKVTGYVIPCLAPHVFTSCAEIKAPHLTSTWVEPSKTQA